eukprot:9490831-Pyramimonas_sp.AAC.3
MVAVGEVHGGMWDFGMVAPLYPRGRRCHSQAGTPSSHSSASGLSKTHSYDHVAVKTIVTSMRDMAVADLGSCGCVYSLAFSPVSSISILSSVVPLLQLVIVIMEPVVSDVVWTARNLLIEVCRCHTP